MINITESAKNKIIDLITEENNEKLKLRMFVQGGGCSGFSYGFTFDEEQNDDDFEYVYGKTKILVDSMSYTYIQGATIDYIDDITGSQFKIENPNATSTCGCGSSFSI